MTVEAPKVFLEDLPCLTARQPEHSAGKNRGRHTFSGKRRVESRSCPTGVWGIRRKNDHLDRVGPKCWGN